MKSLISIALIFSATASLAGESYICREIGGDQYAPKKMILTQIGSERIEEGKRHAFKLEFFEGNNRALVESVNVKIEDVMFRFTNTAKKVGGMLYMDELEQSWLKIGKEEIQFDCR